MVIVSQNMLRLPRVQHFCQVLDLELESWSCLGNSTTDHNQAGNTALLHFCPVWTESSKRFSSACNTQSTDMSYTQTKPFTEPLNNPLCFSAARRAIKISVIRSRHLCLDSCYVLIEVRVGSPLKNTKTFDKTNKLKLNMTCIISIQAMYIIMQNKIKIYKVLSLFALLFHQLNEKVKPRCNCSE